LDGESIGPQVVPANRPWWVVIGNKSWQQTVHGASTSPHIRVRALIAAADAFHGIGLARLFALLSHV